MPRTIRTLCSLKSDGIPTYHFAHVVDDHLMRTTHVVRGEEWLATLPIHVQLFRRVWALNAPYTATPPVLMKMDGETKRKLSKRKDPELGLDYYRAKGYAPKAVWEYLLTVLNSNFEEWRLENPDAPIDDFKFTTEKMSSSGALFDIVKFEDISREVLLRTPASQIYDEFSQWLERYDPEFYKIFTRDRQYSESIIDVGRSGNRPRKDLTNWEQASAVPVLLLSPRALYCRGRNIPKDVSPEDKAEILKRRYLDGPLTMNDDNSQWFQKNTGYYRVI